MDMVGRNMTQHDSTWPKNITSTLPQVYDFIWHYMTCTFSKGKFRWCSRTLPLLWLGHWWLLYLSGVFQLPHISALIFFRRKWWEDMVTLRFSLQTCGTGERRWIHFKCFTNSGGRTPSCRRRQRMSSRRVGKTFLRLDLLSFDLSIGL